jgi:hypothetical protein
MILNDIMEEIKEKKQRIKQIALRIPSDLYEKLKKLKEERAININKYIELAIIEKLKKDGIE